MERYAHKSDLHFFEENPKLQDAERRHQAPQELAGKPYVLRNARQLYVNKNFSQIQRTHHHHHHHHYEDVTTAECERARIPGAVRELHGSVG
ncbi:hypothetical protein CRUP_028845 [Coryphaenoides rupestris]|nr:hypothetical protein CRUP_028845 [Coryphaenoides rupestris]